MESIASGGLTPDLGVILVIIFCTGGVKFWNWSPAEGDFAQFFAAINYATNRN